MDALTASLVATAAVLLAVVLVHGYAQWTIRNVDRDDRAHAPSETPTPASRHEPD